MIIKTFIMKNKTLPFSFKRTRTLIILKNIFSKKYLHYYQIKLIYIIKTDVTFKLLDF